MQNKSEDFIFISEPPPIFATKSQNSERWEKCKIIMIFLFSFPNRVLYSRRCRKNTKKDSDDKEIWQTIQHNAAKMIRSSMCSGVQAIVRINHIALMNSWFGNVWTPELLNSWTSELLKNKHNIKVRNPVAGSKKRFWRFFFVWIYLLFRVFFLFLHLKTKKQIKHGRLPGGKL